MAQADLTILGLESSCDETAAAVVRGRPPGPGTILSSIVASQDEAHAPYDRPPLSKAVLQGEVPAAQLVLIAPDAFAALQADWRPGQRVAAIDRAAREVITAGGERVRYDTLFLANGGQARRLPGLPPHPRVLTLRTYEDAMAIKRQVEAAQHVLVMGGGWIGLEVAASARQQGKAVTVLEAAPRLCIRTVPPCVSEHLQALHAERGVTLRLGCAVEAVDASDRGVTVLLAGGDYRMGQVIGASDARGGAVTQAPYPPQSILAMVYRHLGIDPAMTFPDFTGRPRHILEEREPIVELL